MPVNHADNYFLYIFILHILHMLLEICVGGLKPTAKVEFLNHHLLCSILRHLAKCVLAKGVKERACDP